MHSYASLCVSPLAAPADSMCTASRGSSCTPGVAPCLVADGKDQPEDPFFRVPKEDGTTMICPCFDPTACAIQCCPWDDPRDE
eukprot:6333942-Pyramimonas_sp.AAC.1